MEKKFINIGETINLLGLSRPTINRLIARGEIPSYKVGKRRLFDRDELAEWIKGHRDDFHVPTDHVRQALIALEEEFSPEVIKNLNLEDKLALHNIFSESQNQSMRSLLRLHASVRKDFGLLSLFSQKKCQTA